MILDNEGGFGSATVEPAYRIASGSKIFPRRCFPQNRMYQIHLAPDSNLPSEGAKTNAGLGNSPLELWVEHRHQKPSYLVSFKIATDMWGVPGDESTREEGWRGELPVAPSNWITTGGSGEVGVVPDKF